MFVTLELISGVCFGIQFITKDELGEFDDGWFLLLEFGIFRVIVEK